MALAPLRTMPRPFVASATEQETEVARQRSAQRQRSRQAAIDASYPYACQVCELIEPHEADALRQAMSRGEMIAAMMEQLFMKYKLPRPELRGVRS